jgi:hypothetical protein
MSITQVREAFPIGTKVRYYPIWGDAKFHECEICSEPWMLGHGAVIIKVTGKSGGVSVHHLTCQPKHHNHITER